VVSRDQGVWLYIDAALVKADAGFDSLVRRPLYRPLPEVDSYVSEVWAQNSSEPEGEGPAPRALKSVADRVFSPQRTTYVDRSGTERAVGDAEYRNRLLAFVERSIASGSQRGVVSTELNLLAAKLEALSELGSKGVHSQVTVEEARTAVEQTYVFIGEIAVAYFRTRRS